MKKSIFKKWGVLVTILIVCMGILSACAGQKLSSDFDEEQVKAAAENVIGLLNSQDKQGLLDLCTVEMQNALTDDVMSQIYAAVGEGGAFVEVEDMGVAGTTNKANDEELAVVVAKAKYEIKTFTYTIVFTKQIKLAGLYYK